MEYEVFKNVLSEEEYLSKWHAANQLTEELKQTVYNKYKVKCLVFQRDEFTCQNEECKWPDKALTMHHVRWQKNGGKDAERNCLTLCAMCHKAFHTGKRKLVVRSREALPSHLNGKTFEINKRHEIDWKVVKAEMKQIRRNLRHLWNKDIDDDKFRALMVYLFMPYDDDWE